MVKTKGSVISYRPARPVKETQTMPRKGRTNDSAALSTGVAERCKATDKSLWRSLLTTIQSSFLTVLRLTKYGNVIDAVTSYKTKRAAPRVEDAARVLRPQSMIWGWRNWRTGLW